MSESFYDIIVVLFYTAIPLIFVLLQIILSTKKKILWGFILPSLWTTLGLWMTIRNHDTGSIFTTEMLLFFLMGDVILFGIVVLVRYLKYKNKKRK